MQSKYTKSQRVIAIIGIILLIALYIITLVSAIFATKATANLFRGCIIASVLIPLMIFGYIKIAKLLTGR